MNHDTEKLLADEGWQVECLSPLELRHSDGSFASGQAAGYVIDALQKVPRLQAQDEALAAIEATATTAAAACTASGFEQNLWKEVARQAGAARAG